MREAFIFESFATRRLKECLQQPAKHERRWGALEEAVEAGEEALPRLQGAQLSQWKALSMRLKNVLSHWHLGIRERFQELIEAQDLERLEDLMPWIQRSGLQQRPEAQALLRPASTHYSLHLDCIKEHIKEHINIY